MQKNETGKKIPHLFRISWNLLSKSWSNLLDSPYGSFSQVMEQLFWPFLAYFSNVLFDRFPSKLSLTTNHLLENVAKNATKLFNGPYVWCFWMILLPWDARNTICLALIGYFSQNTGLIPGRSWFCIFFYNFCVFIEIFVSNIFENISKPVGFLEKAMNTCFVANLPSF